MRRNVFVLGLVSFFTDIHSEIVIPLRPLFLDALGAPKWGIGFIEGLGDTVASLLNIVSGRFSDRLRRRKPWVCGGYILSTLTKPLLAFVSAWWQAALVQVGDRLGKGIRSAPRDALLADSVPSERRGLAFGFHRAMDTAGAVVGTAIASLLLRSHVAFPQAFLLAAIPGVVAVLLVIALAQEVPSPKAAAKSPAWDWRSLSPTYWWFIAANGLYSLAHFSDALFLLRAKEVVTPLMGREAASAFAVFAYFVYNVVYAVSATPLGGAIDRFGRRRGLLATYLLFAVAAGGFACADAVWHVWVCFIVLALHRASVNPVARALIAELSQSGTRGAAMGAYYATIGLAVLPSNALAGRLWDQGGALLPFGAAAALTVAATGVAWWKLR
ncbi:MAG: MFS transporter [Abditibacteriales bacterium]|nr:MFS transporter [Abditibacteriales bacterium]